MAILVGGTVPAVGRITVEGRVSSQSGQTSVEYMLVVGVVVVAVVAAAYTFVPIFSNGVNALAEDVERILGDGEVGGSNGRNGNNNNGLNNPQGIQDSDRGPSIALDGLDQVADNGNNPFNDILKDLGKDFGKDLGRILNPPDIMTAFAVF